MKFIVWLGLMAIIASEANAQRGGYGVGVSAGGMHGGVGRAGTGPGAFGGPGVRRFNRRFGTPYVSSFSLYPFFDGDYDFGYTPYPYQTQPTTIVVEPVQPVIVAQAPAQVGNPVIHTYSVAAAPAGGQQPTFVIVLTNGSRVEAVAVWVQDGILHYVDPDDRPHQVPLASVDRALTRKLNEDRGLILRLPAPQAG